MEALGRWSKKAREWSKQVKDRDGWVCKHCGIDEKSQLQSHHIIPWMKSVELRFDINNGLTLCKVCHIREDRRIGDFKIGDWSKGRKFTPEHVEKLSVAKIGRPSWNKGLVGVQSSTRKGIAQPHMAEHRRLALEASNKVTKGRSWRINEYTGKREWYDK